MTLGDAKPGDYLVLLEPGHGRFTGQLLQRGHGDPRPRSRLVWVYVPALQSDGVISLDSEVRPATAEEIHAYQLSKLAGGGL